MRQPAMTPEGVTYDYVRAMSTSRSAPSTPSPTAVTNPSRIPASHLYTVCCRPQDALCEWLSSKQTDPSTNLPLSADQLCPNRTVRSMIEDFIAKGPNFLTSK